MRVSVSMLQSLGGHQPYVPIGLADDDTKKNNSTGPGANSNNFNTQYGSASNNELKQRARVLCSYDAKDSTELNLSANEVNIDSILWIYSNKNECFCFSFLFQIIFVTECNPTNSDYMYGKQGLVNGLVPRAFLELLDE